LFIHPFILSFIHPYIHLFFHSFIYSFIHSFIHSFIQHILNTLNVMVPFTVPLNLPLWVLPFQMLWIITSVVSSITVGFNRNTLWSESHFTQPVYWFINIPSWCNYNWPWADLKIKRHHIKIGFCNQVRCPNASFLWSDKFSSECKGQVKYVQHQSLLFQYISIPVMEYEFIPHYCVFTCDEMRHLGLCIFKSLEKKWPDNFWFFPALCQMTWL